MKSPKGWDELYELAKAAWLDGKVLTKIVVEGYDGPERETIIDVGLCMIRLVKRP